AHAVHPTKFPLGLRPQSTGPARQNQTPTSCPDETATPPQPVAARAPSKPPARSSYYNRCAYAVLPSVPVAETIQLRFFPKTRQAANSFWERAACVATNRALQCPCSVNAGKSKRSPCLIT